MKFMNAVLLNVLLVCVGCAKPPVSTPSLKQATTREVKFESHGLMLEGTLQLPLSGSGKAPAVLILPGSGPTDRDGNSLLGIKTDLHKQIAEQLAAVGIASLRFDKRAIRHYAANWPKDVAAMSKYFCWENFVDDATAGFDFLSKQPEVDSSRVGIIGHSEGAMISLQIGANRSGKANAPKAILLLGGTGRPMGIILHEQIARSLKKNKASDEVAKPYLDYVDNASKALAAGDALPGNIPKGLESLFNPTALDLMRSYCRIDPSELAKQVGGPVLVLNGAHDGQVSAERDAPKLFAALQSRKSGKAELAIIPDASHNLKSTKGGDDDAFTGPAVPEAMAKIVQFAKANL